MKALRIVTLIILILGFAYVSFPVAASRPILADQINTCLSTVNWNIISDTPSKAHFSPIFNGQNIYDQVITAAESGLYEIFPAHATSISRQVLVLQLRRIADVDGISSSTIDQETVDALSTVATTANWISTPYIDWPNLVYWRFLPWAYEYAQQSGVAIQVLNQSEAYQQFVACYNSSPSGFLYFDPAAGTAQDSRDRYYDENAQPLGMFLGFSKLGQREALEEAIALWDHLCADHWSGSHFPYSRFSGMVECEAGSFAEIIGDLYVQNGCNLSNFPSYILQDLDYKLVENGDWSGLLWSPGAYVVRHAERNLQKRLQNTLVAWAAMHSYYALMDSKMRANFDRLLTGGSIRAWRGLVDYSGMYINGMFMMSNNTVPSDEATLLGSMILFLNGIVPQTGSLALPVLDECYEDTWSMFPAHMLRFDYATHTIRVPVWAGNIDFVYGSGTASYDFPDDGVYDIQFSSDWNAVTNVTRKGSLDQRFSYLKADSSAPSKQFSLRVKAQDATGEELSGLRFSVNGTYLQTTPCTWTLGVGNYPIQILDKTVDNLEFDHWSDGKTSNPCIVNLTSDTDIIAVFKTADYMLPSRVRSSHEPHMY